jgi:hypothetical protein
VSGNGTAGQALLSDGDGSMSWGSAGKPFLGNVIEVTSNTTLTADDSQSQIIVKGAYAVTLPAFSTGLVFGFLNKHSEKVLVVCDSDSDSIDGSTGSVYIDSGAEALIVTDDTGWQILHADSESGFTITQLSTGTYTPASYVNSFYVACVGGSGPLSLNEYGGSGGGGFCEKYVSSPSGSYTVVVAGAGGTSTFNGSGVALSASGGTINSAGSGSGGSFNASGGIPGNGSAGGGGAAGSRAGDGGAGSYGNNSGGAGGGNGGSASGDTPGPAANAAAANAYSGISSLDVFYPGNPKSNSGNYRGGDGANAGCIGGGGGRGGAPADEIKSSNGRVAIVEFF